jgi:hypothetical protein
VLEVGVGSNQSQCQLLKNLVYTFAMSSQLLLPTGREQCSVATPSAASSRLPLKSSCSNQSSRCYSGLSLSHWPSGCSAGCRQRRLGYSSCSLASDPELRVLDGSPTLIGYSMSSRNYFYVTNHYTPMYRYLTYIQRETHVV